MTTSAYREHRYTAQDGLSLYYRDYGDPLSDATPILCLAGLTRNSADFDDLAQRLSPTRRVLCPDYRGRGQSDYDDDWRNYQAPQYMVDIDHLLTLTGCHRVIVIGTSLGGILAMLLSALRPAALVGVVLNDIGPEIDPRGIAHIASYVGGLTSVPDMPAAARQLREEYTTAYPDFSDEDWLKEAGNRYRQTDDGRWILSYDLKLAKAFTAQTSEQVDLWPMYRGLRNVPTLAIRGALSDILSEETFQRMAVEKPDLVRISVPRRGHVPLLNEPECHGAIDEFLSRLDDDRH